MLFGELWYQGELCILFADTNMGKSVLAVQIGNALAERRQMPPFGCEAPQQNVVYIDFELSGKQFQARYTHNDVIYRFAKGFYRAGFNPNANMPYDYKTYDDYMNAAIENVVKKTAARVLIIDNITCLRNGTEHANNALPLMKHLKALKTKHKLSILALAHTPKRNAMHPLSVNDLQGSKMLINFADSAFAIGQSGTDKSLKYLKQIKQRNTQQLYGADNVCLFRIQKPINFLQFEFEGYSRESLHLVHETNEERQQLAEKVKALTAQGMSQRGISRQLGISLGLVNKLVVLVDVSFNTTL
jgi:archaellum biogenesis ATPase FlaH